MSRKISPRDKKTPGGRLFIAREALGFTVNDLAAKLCYSQSHISEIETGVKNIPKRLIALIEEKLRINGAWILSGEGEMFLTGGKEDSETGKGEFYKVIDTLSGKCTIVTNEEMGLIHDLLCILKSKDSGVKEAIKSNLREFKRLSGFLSPKFGDIILLERRIKLVPAAPDKREVGNNNC